MTLVLIMPHDLFMSEIAVQRYILVLPLISAARYSVNIYRDTNLNNVASLSDTKHLVLLDDVHHHQ